MAWRAVQRSTAARQLHDQWWPWIRMSSSAQRRLQKHLGKPVSHNIRENDSRRFRMKIMRNTLIGCVVTAPLWFGIGRLTSAPVPRPINIELTTPWVDGRECVYQPPECPVVECPMWPMHKESLAAMAETARLDAYLAGAESIWWTTESCEQVAMHGPDSCCSQVVDQVWDVEHDLSMLNLRVRMESVENGNWWRACRELLRVWPTESEIEGNYPSDFPKYCW